MDNREVEEIMKKWNACSKTERTPLRPQYFTPRQVQDGHQNPTD